MEHHEISPKNSRKIYRFLIIICTLAIIAAIIIFYQNGDMPQNESYTNISEDHSNRIENGIHLRTGLVDAPGLTETVNNCTTCHSAKLIVQNRMNKERWEATIRWMQETQNLWDLGANEEIIINYLVANYPPQQKGRRAVLKEIDWYVLKD